jgi:hypothetical protein
MMRYHTLLFMITLMFCATPLYAQEATPDVEPTLTFVSENGAVIFDYPDGWNAEQDSPTTFILSSDNLSLIMELVETVQDDQDATQLLEVFFADAGYSEPETFDLNLDEETIRQAARIGNDNEEIYIAYVDETHFILLFVSGEQSVRASVGENILNVIRSFEYTEIENGRGIIRGDFGNSPRSDEQPTVNELDIAYGEDVGFAEDVELATETFTFVDGELTLRYPADMNFEVLEPIGFFLTNAEGAPFSIVTLGDLETAFGLIGLEGNPAELTTPVDVLSAVLGETATAIETIAPIEYTINDRAIARIDVSDAAGDNSLIAVELARETLIIMLVNADQGELIRLNHIVESIISAMEYRPGVASD